MGRQIVECREAAEYVHRQKREDKNNSKIDKDRVRRTNEIIPNRWVNEIKADVNVPQETRIIKKDLVQ